MKLSRDQVAKRIYAIGAMGKDEIIECFNSLHVEDLDFKAKGFICRAIDIRVLELMDSRNYV